MADPRARTRGLPHRVHLSPRTRYKLPAPTGRLSFRRGPEMVGTPEVTSGLEEANGYGAAQWVGAAAAGAAATPAPIAITNAANARTPLLRCFRLSRRYPLPRTARTLPRTTGTLIRSGSKSAVLIAGAGFAEDVTKRVGRIGQRNSPSLHATVAYARSVNP